MKPVARKLALAVASIALGLTMSLPLSAQALGNSDGRLVVLARNGEPNDNLAWKDTVQSVRGAVDASGLTVVEAVEFLKSEAAKLHCCATDDFLEAAMLYKRAAELRLGDDPAGLDDLRLAAYFYYYGGQLERAFSSMARVGVIARDRGSTRMAGQAFLEAAHIALESGDIGRARQLLLISDELLPQDKSGEQ